MAASMMAHAHAKADADAAYRQADYQKAVALYQQALKDGASAETYYNMGNAYYRMGNYPQAMLAYQKAKKISPANVDIQHNIEITLRKTIDRMPIDDDVFFVVWYKALINTLSIDAWACVARASLILSLILFLCYLFLSNMAIVRISFYSSVALFAVFALANIFAWHQHHIMNSHSSAIVISEVASVKSAPAAKTADAFVLHEGTYVTITDSDIQGWRGIKLADGREGWIPSSKLAEI